MPTDYRILKNPDLVHVRFWGHVKIDEITTKLDAFAADPAYTPGLRHYFDVAGVTSFEQNLPKIMAWQAQVATVLDAPAPEQMMVFHAPPGPPAELIGLIRKSWEGMPHPIIMRVLNHASEAFEVLGIKETDLASLSAGFSED